MFNITTFQDFLDRRKAIETAINCNSPQKLTASTYELYIPPDFNQNLVGNSMENPSPPSTLTNSFRHELTTSRNSRHENDRSSFRSPALIADQGNVLLKPARTTAEATTTGHHFHIRQPLQQRTNRGAVAEIRCTICKQFIRDDVVHFMMECPKFWKERSDYLRILSHLDDRLVAPTLGPDDRLHIAIFPGIWGPQPKMQVQCYWLKFCSSQDKTSAHSKPTSRVFF